jgi:hypothetical protein
MIPVTSAYEEDAAREIRDLAEALQTLLCYADGDGLSGRSKTILTRCYRILKQTTDHYFEQADNPLVWNAATPGTPYKKRG